MAGRAPVPPRIALGVAPPSRVQNGQVGSAQVVAWGSQGRGPKARPIVLQPGPALGRQQTGDRQVNALQEAQRVATSQAKANPLGSCNFIQGITFSGAGGQLIAHGLGRAFVSCVVCGLATSASAIVAIQRPSGIAQDQVYISVAVSAACAFDLLVF
jgi:hypothetical protein